VSKDDGVTPEQIYRDLTDNGRLDGRYTPAELKQAFELERTFNGPPAYGPDVSPQRIAIQAPPSHPETSTPATAVPEFWIALFLFGLLLWWCVDHIVIAGRRKR
jgi:hypothetical protein